MLFNADSVRQLSIHSSNPSSTYAYYFTENVRDPAFIPRQVPDWLETSADHGDEIPFVFGSVYGNERNLWNGKITLNITAKIEYIE